MPPWYLGIKLGSAGVGAGSGGLGRCVQTPNCGPSLNWFPCTARCVVVTSVYSARRPGGNDVEDVAVAPLSRPAIAGAGTGSADRVRRPTGRVPMGLYDGPRDSREKPVRKLWMPRVPLPPPRTGAGTDRAVNK